LEAIHKKVQKQNPDSDEEEAVLLNILRSHSEREEEILYPVLDELMTFMEKEVVFTRIQELPEEKYKTCCDVKLN